MSERDRAGILGQGIIISNLEIAESQKKNVASVKSAQDVTDRPRNEVIEYYCFFITIIVGPPYFPDPVLRLK